MTVLDLPPLEDLSKMVYFELQTWTSFQSDRNQSRHFFLGQEVFVLLVAPFSPLFGLFVSKAALRRANAEASAILERIALLVLGQTAFVTDNAVGMH